MKWRHLCRRAYFVNACTATMYSNYFGDKQLFRNLKSELLCNVRSFKLSVSEDSCLPRLAGFSLLKSVVSASYNLFVNGFV